MGVLEGGIQIAQSKEEADTNRFAKEIAEEVPKLGKKLQGVREALEKPRLASLDSPVAETLAAVEKLGKEFDATKQRCAELARCQVP